MDETLVERGFAPGSSVVIDAAHVEHANKQYGKAVARLRLLEAETKQAFQMLAEAVQGQQKVGNGAAEPAMSAFVGPGWKAYKESLRAGRPAREGSDAEWPQPPILDWPDP